LPSLAKRTTYKGRVKVVDAVKVAAVKERLAAAGVHKAKAAREFGISRPTLYAYLNSDRVVVVDEMNSEG
jgi:DNA invertase Pin-like site-specific DNA recombinase